jgi:hypothetical protein
VGDLSRPSSAKSRLVAAMDRLDRLMAELDGAVARLDARTVPPAVAIPEANRQSATATPRARWYWTTPAAAAPPPPGELAEVTAQP